MTNDPHHKQIITCRGCAISERHDKMTNDPWRKRTPRSTLVQWLMDNPSVWEGYPKPASEIVGRSHSLYIFSHMKADGLFSPRSQCNPASISRLVEDARMAKKLNDIGVGRLDP